MGNILLNCMMAKEKVWLSSWFNKEEKLKIQPKTGAAIIFKHEKRHSGNIIKKGVKYVLRTDVMYKTYK